MQDEHPRRPSDVAAMLLYDGVEEPVELVLESVAADCPVCGAACMVDPSSVVRDGRAAGLATSPHVDQLQDVLLAGLVFDVSEFDGRRVIRGPGGTWPHVHPVRCDACDAALVAVVSFGEVQPARYWVVFDGVLVVDDGLSGTLGG